MKKEEKATFMETKRANLMVIKANLAVPDELQDLVSEYTVYMGGDPWTDDERLWNYCKEKGLVNYKNQGSVFLMLTLAFRTKSLDPSYTISEKFASKADSIAKTIEENISTSLKAPFKRMTLKRRDTYYDYHNNNTKGT